MKDYLINIVLSIFFALLFTSFSDEFFNFITIMLLMYIYLHISSKDLNNEK